MSAVVAPAPPWSLDASKKYPDATGIELPVGTAIASPLEAAILQKTSEREYSVRATPLTFVSTMLYLSYGPSRPTNVDVGPADAGTASESASTTTKADSGLWTLRPAPSASGLFPLEIYLVSLNIEELPQGVLHYQRDSHRLELLKTADSRAELQQTLYGLVDFTLAGLLFVISATFSRTPKKYRERGYRYVLLEAGHVGQNLLLSAEALGLASVPLGGFCDDRLNALLGIDGETEAAVYGVAIGQQA